MKPVDSVQHAQRPDQRTQRRPLSTLEVLDRVQGDAGLVGELSLIDVLPESERADLPAKLSFPFVGSLHGNVIDAKWAIVN